MSVIPTEWREPDSRPGLYYELLWTVLAVAVLGAIVHWEPSSIAVDVTTTRLFGSLALGGILAGGLAYVSFGNERIQQLWSDSRIRFVALFALIMSWQLGFDVAPTWTLLAGLATCLAYVPLRVFVYRHTQ